MSGKSHPTPVWTKESSVLLRYQTSSNSIYIDCVAYANGAWEVCLAYGLGSFYSRGASGREATQEDACKRALIVAYALTYDLKTLEDS